MQSIAQKTLIVLSNDYKAFAHEVLTVGASVVSLTLPTNPNTNEVIAKYALITVEGADVTDGMRFWMDGSAPTSTDGLLRLDGSVFDITETSNLSNFKAIGVNAGATLQIQYFR